MSIYPLPLHVSVYLFYTAHSLHMGPLARTRRAMLDGGFLSTMYSIIDVAMLSPYLWIGRVRQDSWFYPSLSFPAFLSFNPFQVDRWGGIWLHYVPCKDVLSVVVPQVDLGRSSEGDPASLIVHHAHKFGFCKHCVLPLI